MKKFFFRTLLLIILMGQVTTVCAQEQQVSHTVKEGETLSSIAKQYRVTPYAILQQNPEIKSSDQIRADVILVIPQNGRPQPAVETIKTKKLEEPDSITPIGFKRHKVRRKETIFSLTQKYEVTEDQLKRYNKVLYASQLRKGMILQIPKFPEVELVEERSLDMESYIVQPKETRWSIANKYGITVDSLVVLNPELSKGSSYLAAGQELQLPRPKGDSLQEQEVILFESFTVPKAMGLFRVSQNYGISVDSVMKLNPEIKEIGGLKEGMVLRLPKQKADTETINTDNYIFYEVKPKQNIFRLTKNLNISRDSLFSLNPELENGLKAGMVLKLPKSKETELEVKNALVLDQINLIDSIDIAQKPNVVFLLPFRLNDIQFADREKSLAQVEQLSGVSYAAGLYTGAMVALDSLKKLGMSVNVSVFDTQRDLEYLKTKLNTLSIADKDVIIGPLDQNLLDEVAARASQYNIPVVAPLASIGRVSQPNVFYARPNQDVLRKRLLDFIAEKRTNESIIVIADEKHQREKDSILARFPMARVAKMAEDGSLHLIDFQTMLSEEEENWVFVETNKANLATSVSSILNASIGPVEEGGDIRVKMFTTDYNRSFEAESIKRPHLSKLEFTFPSYFREVQNNAFVKAYRKKYGYAPDRAAVRGFDVTFDVLLKIAQQGNLFETEKFIGETRYNGSRFNYRNDFVSGFFNQASYLLQYQDLTIKEIN